MRVLAFSGGKDSMACLHLMKDTLACAIYVDTGKSYPETMEMVRYAETILPVIIVKTDQEAQNNREGLPADVVPIDWTRHGQLVTKPKQIMIQSYLSCCFENVSYPLFAKAKEIRATEIVYGQRDDDDHKASAQHGQVIDGITRLHPIANWSSFKVLEYLATVMEVPEHYTIKHSSLDCYDCTAYRSDSSDRIRFTRKHHPDFYDQYLQRMTRVNQALVDALNGEQT